MSELMKVSSNPHIRDKMSTDKIMLAVVAALMPTTIFGIWNFGIRAALIIAGAMAVVFLLVFALAAFMQGGLTLSGPMILILIAATLIVSIVTPIVQYFLWRDGRKK